MAPNPPLTSEEVLRVTRASINILNVLRYDFCLFGSAACNYYGMNSRVAQDVDILVLAWDVDEEWLKEEFVQRDKNLYRVDSVKPEATYTVLWYELPDERKCKVDLLHFGVMGIPGMPPDIAYYVRSRGYRKIPLLPLIPLLFLKLIGWRKRARSILWHWRKKVPNDEEDILNLLDIAISRPDIGHLSSVPWITTAFRRRARLQISRFVQKYPDSIAKWRAIGFRFLRRKKCHESIVAKPRSYVSAGKPPSHFHAPRDLRALMNIARFIGWKDMRYVGL
ncbi:hypothetical protein PLEOSDRAFT_167606 [Pleurotus ostreatus PC15]|uniref:Uncharacterized protein n=1 Tax=Pleurotus ostreatus (strain PC15) TaxID=1137138 RepID=A0A067P1Q0_PLEO1|nr:hypothetical protein PLEOSDRAFT_167606 [Pleurotus ostreatus PC15]